jgi:signal transduction histidine kinase
LEYYTIANGIVVGICLGFSIIFLFIGLRRRDNKRLNLLFAVFALAYAATLFNGIRFHNASSAELYVTITRGDTIFVVLAFTTLIWYVAEYTQVKPRVFLWGLTALFIVTGITQITRTNMLYGEIHGLNTVAMPWGEQVAYLEATDSLWSTLFLVGQLLVLGFMIFACIRQYVRGDRKDALILSIGVLWFVTSIAAELLGEAGVIAPIFYGEFGFLGFVVALSLQMSNEIIETEEELDLHRHNLESLVDARTAKLEEAQEQLLQQTQEQATLEERNRLARDLHDAVTQTIYSAALIAEALPQIWERSPDEGQRNLIKLRQLVRGALAEMRALLFELRPAALEAVDLELLLRQQCDALTGRTRIPVNLTVEGQAELPPEVKITFYRITQEAFNNIAKHAQADRVKVTLQQAADEVILTIEDNGRGFEKSAIPAEGMGIQFMRERASNIDASLKVKSQPAQGTHLAVAWSREREATKATR